MKFQYKTDILLPSPIISRKPPELSRSWVHSWKLYIKLLKVILREHQSKSYPLNTPPWIWRKTGTCSSNRRKRRQTVTQKRPDIGRPSKKPHTSYSSYCRRSRRASLWWKDTSRRTIWRLYYPASSLCWQRLSDFWNRHGSGSCILNHQKSFGRWCWGWSVARQNGNMRVSTSQPHP